MPRRCEVLTEHGTWRPLPFASLTPGMVFRLFEETGQPVTEEEGRVWRWRVLGAPTQDEQGMIITTEPLEETEAEHAVRSQGFYWPGGTHGHLR